EFPYTARPPPRARRGVYPSIVFVPAGSRFDRSGNDEGDVAAHTAASNDADATCDSCSVTRILRIARPSDPRPPLRIAAATRSNTVFARTSVVVLRPANAASSSRLR